ncbi:MAG: hypothetical protein COT18_02830 [Elusimicrobia bacterium CG08_land_8_20_14_0_20_59_10]|nr:MAG: hypothetical protein COT18_02830 [Elusimicrobia bacterium CG08_land_8_20_14_0_20_59_10]
MPRHDTTKNRAARIFHRRQIADMAVLKHALGTPSRTTVFRVLSSAGYLTSYSHAGRYYTLRGIPQFDEAGIWAHGEALFSKDGTLRATIVRMVGESPAGNTHDELQAQLHLRVHDTLLDLVRDYRIGRADLDRRYLYVSSDKTAGKEQVAQRRRMLAAEPSPVALPEPNLLIEILLAVIHQSEREPAGIAAALSRQGQKVSREQIEAVFARYGLGKKKGAWKRSQP